MACLRVAIGGGADKAGTAVALDLLDLHRRCIDECHIVLATTLPEELGLLAQGHVDIDVDEGIIRLAVAEETTGVELLILQRSLQLELSVLLHPHLVGIDEHPIDRLLLTGSPDQHDVAVVDPGVSEATVEYLRRRDLLDHLGSGAGDPKLPEVACSRDTVVVAVAVDHIGREGCAADVGPLALHAEGPLGEVVRLQDDIGILAIHGAIEIIEGDPDVDRSGLLGRVGSILTRLLAGGEGEGRKSDDEGDEYILDFHSDNDIVSYLTDVR